MPYKDPEADRARSKLRYERDKERAKVHAATWRAANKDKIRASSKRYYAENVEKIRAYQRRYNATHKPKNKAEYSFARRLIYKCGVTIPFVRKNRPELLDALYEAHRAKKLAKEVLAAAPKPTRKPKMTDGERAIARAASTHKYYERIKGDLLSDPEYQRRNRARAAEWYRNNPEQAAENSRAKRAKHGAEINALESLARVLEIPRPQIRNDYPDLLIAAKTLNELKRYLREKS